MVRPGRFELPTFCSGGRNSQEINELAVGTTVVSDSYTLLVSSRLRHSGTATLATTTKASMWGVGTVLGTAAPPHTPFLQMGPKAPPKGPILRRGHSLQDAKTFST